jgi:signal transduction histidine kinase
VVRCSLSHLRLALGLLTGVMLWLLWQASTITTPEIESIKLRYLLCEALFGVKTPNSLIGPEYTVIDNWRGFFPLAILFGVVFSITKPLARFILLIVFLILGAAAGIYWFHAVKFIVPLGGPALLLCCSYLCGSLIHLETERIERNRNLALDLLNHSETARKKIAEEIHDETLPTLSRTLRLVDELQKKHNEDPLPGELRSKLESTVSELRRIIDDLHPAALERLGLRAAIEMLVDQCKRHGNVNIKLLAAECPDGLPKMHELCVYRIVQEALTNIERHSNATEAEVSIDWRDKRLHIRIVDNGVGGVNKKLRSLGLQNIANRASAIGATVRWAQPEQYPTGTSLDVWIPADKQKDVQPATDATAKPQTS